ncbi:MAG: ABC transporter permease [Firmicutes bacterium]|nr:ABC transporter permease [Bacillota bacterium]
MASILESIVEAIRLLISLDPEVVGIAWLSLRVSGAATCVSILLGVPAGVLLALNDFPGRRLVIGLVNTGMGLPPVVVGLIVSMLFWRSGPFGQFEMMYTPGVMIIAQVCIALPIVTGLSLAAIQQLNPRLRLQSLALGASKIQSMMLLVRESRLPMLAAIMAGFGGVISEVGAVMMVGGNIKGQTRVLTTAMVLESRMGHFEMALALGILLLGLSFGVNAVLTNLQQKGARRWTGRS